MAASERPRIVLQPSYMVGCRLLPRAICADQHICRLAVWLRRIFVTKHLRSSELMDADYFHVFITDQGRSRSATVP